MFQNNYIISIFRLSVDISRRRHQNSLISGLNRNYWTMITLILLIRYHIYCFRILFIDDIIGFIIGFSFNILYFFKSSDNILYSQENDKSLYNACKENNLQLVLELIKAGANVNMIKKVNEDVSVALS